MATVVSGSCPPAQRNYTVNELQAQFSGSVLASNPSRTSEGLITQASLNTHIASLKTAGIMPVRPIMEQLPSGTDANDSDSPLATYIQADNNFIKKLKDEFCFYESRYRVALNQLLDNLSIVASNVSNAAANAAFDTYLNITIGLNKKLNDIIQLTNAITIERYTLSRTDQDNINNINEDLASRANELRAQQQILTSDISKAELHKRMVDYTKEKNNATTNLLTLYAVLNIVAIGALVILART